MSQDIYQVVADQEGVTREFVKSLAVGTMYGVGSRNQTPEQLIKKLALQVRFAKTLSKVSKTEDQDGVS